MWRHASTSSCSWTNEVVLFQMSRGISILLGSMSSNMKTPRAGETGNITETPLHMRDLDKTDHRIHRSSEAIHTDVIANKFQVRKFPPAFLPSNVCLVVSVKSESTSLGDQILVDSNILSRLLSVSRLLDSSKWRFSCRGVTCNMCLVLAFKAI